MAMTREEAAAILEISQDATTAQVNTAYRKCVAKYHPDANRNKSEAEQKKAEELFKKCAKAKQIMLAPPEPESAPSQEPAHRPDASRAQETQTSNSAGNRNGTQANYPQAPSGSQHRYGEQVDPRTNSVFNPHRHQQVQNSAKTFMDGIPRVVDDAERQISGFAADEIKKRYKSKFDIIRLTPSIIISICYIVLTIASMFMTSGDAKSIESMLSDTMILFIIAMVVKILIYDTLISYYIHKLFKKLKLSWLIQCGFESAVVIIGYIALSLASASNLNGLLLIGGIIGSILLIGAGFAIKSFKKK